jgi:hypothetical protein
LFNLIFGIIPLVMAFLGSTARLSEREAGRNQRTGEALQDLQLSLIARVANPKTLLGNRLIRTVQYAAHAGQPTAAMIRAAKNFRHRLPEVADFTVVDPNGAMVWTTCPEADPALVKELFRHLRERQAGREEAGAIAADWGKYASFIGPHASSDVLCLSGKTFFPSRVLPERSHFAFHLGDHGGIFAHFHESPHWETSLLLDSLRSLHRRFPKSAVTTGVWLDLPPDSRHGPGQKTPPASVRAAISQHRETGRDITIADGLICSILETAPGRFFWATLPILPNGRNLTLFRLKAILLIFAGLFAVGTWILLRQMQAGTISLRRQLFTLFLCTALPPLLPATAFGFLYHDLAERSDQRQHRQNHLRILEGIGHEFQQNRHSLETTINRKLAHASFATHSDRLALFQALEQVKDVSPHVEIHIFDRRGATVHSSVQGFDSSRARTHKLLSQLFAQVLEKLNTEHRHANAEPMSTSQLAGPPRPPGLPGPHRPPRPIGPAGPAAPALPGTADLLADMIGLKRHPVDDIAEKSGRIMHFSWYLNQCQVYVRPLRSAQTGFSELLALIWLQGPFERGFLNKILKRCQQKLPGGEFLAWRPSGPSVIPEGKPLEPMMYRLQRRVHHRNQPAHAEIIRPSSRSLITAMKSKEFSETYVFLSEKTKSADANGNRIKTAFLTFLSGMLIINLFVGYLLSSQFLQPLQTLETGLVALGELRFQTRLPVGQQDEFGELLATFNLVMEDFQELDLASIIQRSLQPGKPLFHNDIAVEGLSIPASRLGGDFFEYRLLPDGRLFVFIGDVSGHGVPAALVMALIKGVLEDDCRRPPPAVMTLPAILGAVNGAIFRNFHRKWTLTCLAAIVDPDTATMELARAGHPFPWLVRNGEARILPAEGALLGIRQTLAVAPIRVPLEPGDLVIFCTDGLLGNLLPMDGKQLIPFATRLRAESDHGAGLSPKAVMSVIQQEFPGDPEDDHTILLLSRKCPDSIP